MQMRRQDPGLIRRLEHHGARAVGEQHRGRAIAPVRDARERLGADHQGPAGIAEAHELVRYGKRIHEAAAGGLHAEGRRAAAAEPSLQQRAAVGEDHVGRRGAEGDEIDIGRTDARGIQGGARGALRQVHRRLAACGDVPALDAGALPNPLVARVHHLLEIEVRENFFRKVGAGPGDARILQFGEPCAASAPSAASACAMCAVSPRRAASAAVMMALAKAIPSALPWLFTTMPVRPTMQALLYLRGSRPAATLRSTGRAASPASRLRHEEWNSWRMRSAIRAAAPSMVLRATLPVNPSVTTTSTSPEKMSSPSTNPT